MELVGNVQIVEGNANTIVAIRAVLKEAGIESEGNPDVYVHQYRSFGIDEAREIAERASSRALVSSRRVFVIVTPAMTSEAQNALLKTFEEPADNALFFLIVSSPQMLLPTLRSRAQVISLERERSEFLVDPSAFLKAKPEKRLEMLKPLLDKDEDDKRDLRASILFLSELEKELSIDIEKNRKGLEVVYRARKFITDKGSLMKALLEQVAILA